MHLTEQAKHYFTLMCGKDWKRYKDCINDKYYFPPPTRSNFLLCLAICMSNGRKLSKTQYDILNSLAQQDKDISHMDMPLRSVMVLQRLGLVEHEDYLDDPHAGR